MLDQIDHIGIATEDLDTVIATMEKGLGLRPHFIEVVSDQQVRVAGFKIGESVIEYLEPTAEDSPIGRFLKKRGPGIHHIAYRVKNLEEKLNQLKLNGFQLIDEKPRLGADGKKIAFLHPDSFNKVLIELCESHD